MIKMRQNLLKFLKSNINKSKFSHTKYKFKKTGLNDLLSIIFQQISHIVFKQYSIKRAFLSKTEFTAKIMVIKLSHY